MEFNYLRHFQRRDLIGPPKSWRREQTRYRALTRPFSQSEAEYAEMGVACETTLSQANHVCIVIMFPVSRNQSQFSASVGCLNTDKKMVQCESCDDWFHLNCMKLEPAPDVGVCADCKIKAEDESGKYCSSCYYCKIIFSCSISKVKSVAVTAKDVHLWI